MKFTLITVAALCSLTSAWPSVYTRWMKRAPAPAGTQFYQLQTKSPVPAVSNLWVSLPTDSSNYTLSGTQSAATKFWVRKYNATNTYALLLDTDDRREVALRGPSGVLLYVVDVTTPLSTSIPSGQLMEWATYTMDGNILGVNDGSTLKSRTFVAANRAGSGGYDLALYDGVSNTTQTVSPVTLNFVRAT